MNKLLLSVLCSMYTAAIMGQYKPNTTVNQFIDLTATAGSSQAAIAASYVHNWKLGSKKKWEVGVGGRWTNYIGTKIDFITAPARLARSNTIPFAIVFAGQKTENWDTLTVQRPFTASFNITANFGYNVGAKWYGGFNIDLLGITFGRKGSGILVSNGTTRNERQAKPARYNVLLTGDHDYGTLNSEFFIKYKLNNRWNLKAVYQFIFIEYKTETVKQTAPDGTIVDRFRNKANTLGAGVSYNF